MRRLILALLCFAILSVAGCVISPNLSSGSSSSGGGGSTTGVGHLYVSEPSSNEILTFANATGDNGDVTPTAILTGGGLSSPQYIFSDAVNNRLYVANEGGPNILVYNSISTESGNVTVTPARIISCSCFSGPTDVALDTVQDILYVADNGEILAFDGAAGLNGTVSQSETITPGFTPSALLMDSSANTLFTANSTGSAVDILSNVSSLNGTPTGQFILTGLNQPTGLQIDPAGRLIVSNTGSAAINIYTNATQLNGNIAATTIISGSPLQSPAQLAIDPTTNSGELYVADATAGQIIVYTSITTATGNLQGAQPSRTVTGLSAPRGVAIDTSH